MTKKVSFPVYNDAISTLLTQRQYRNFVRKVALGGIPDGKVDADGNQLEACWEWTACLDKAGYGVYSFCTPCKSGGAHRVSAFIVGLTGIKSASDCDNVLHKCDNPACVNPDHLFIGTQKINMADRDKKGRGNQPTGEQNGMAKLTWSQVAAIRARYAAGGTTLRKLASEYGVVCSIMSRIIRNKIWRDESYTPPTKQTRLNQEQRAEVIQLYSQGGTTQQRIAKLYNVNQTTIIGIKMELFDNIEAPQSRKGRPQKAEKKYPFDQIGVGQVLCINEEDVPNGGATSIRSALNHYKRKNNVNAEFKIGDFPDIKGAVGVWRIA